jgi:hypothetical protein
LVLVRCIELILVIDSTLGSWRWYTLASGSQSLGAAVGERQTHILYRDRDENAVFFAAGSSDERFPRRLPAAFQACLELR